MSKKCTLLQLAGTTLAVICFFSAQGCGNQNQTLRDNLNTQADAFTKEKFDELKPAEGSFQGQVHLTASNQDFDCVIDVKRVMTLVRNTQSQDQTEMIEVPKLSGGVRFPILENLSMTDLASYSNLTSPLGGYLKVLFDSGDYDPRNLTMIIPYTVPGYSQGEFGEFNGTLSHGTFSGIWFSKPFGNVGTFNLTLSTTNTQTGGTKNGN